MKKYILIIFSILLSVSSLLAQTKQIEVKGIILDEENIPLVGVNVTIKHASGMGTVSDVDGNYSIKVPPYSTLVFSYIGFVPQEVQIKEENTTIDVVMKVNLENVMEEITITGTGAQKKVTLTGAIATADLATLKTPSSSVANALMGNVSGVMAMQTSGQPGQNTSEFWIRGISTFGAGSSALVLVDGFERDMNDLNIEDIASFSVLKDASATAIYGSRGANGVVLIQTKRGHSGKVKIDAKGEYTYTNRTSTPEFVDGPTYARLINEARTTRNSAPIYTNEELALYASGLDGDVYPNVDWMGMLLKDGAPTYRGSLNLSGGGETSRYYVSTSYLNEGGMFNTDEALKDYNTNTDYSRWNYRMNYDMDITKTSLVRVSVAGSVAKQNQPGFSQDYIWNSLMNQNPIAIPKMYSNGYIPSYAGDMRVNPWVMSTQTGYKENWASTIQLNVDYSQKLDFVTEGLAFTGRFAYDTENKNEVLRQKWPELWRAQRMRDHNGNLVFNRIVPEQLMTQSSSSTGNKKEYIEAILNYNRTFSEDHTVGGTLKYTQDSEKRTVDISSNIMNGIDRRHQGLAGQATYNWKNRYLVDVNFGYNGSENFASGHQFGFFPAFSAAWNIAEENFVKDKFEWLNLLKIRYSYGKVGNDLIQAQDLRRFPYLNEFQTLNYNKNTDAGKDRWKDGWNWGDIDSPYSYSDLTYSVISSRNVTWEVSTKHDLGLDIYILNDRFNMTVDYFTDKRTGIYLQRNYIPSMVGLQAGNPYANIGVGQTKGFDGNFVFRQKVNEVNLELRGNFTYSKSEVIETDEQYSNYPYTMGKGYRIGQTRGLIAQGLFKDYEEIRNSPTQYGHVMPGDIKYKDINADGKIDDNDIVPIGSTVKPNFVYGFAFAGNWKNFDFNILFQGVGKTSFFINGATVYPFQSQDWGNILKDVEESNRWILGVNEDVNAEYPRLTYGNNENNYRASTYWLRDGSYMRLKNLEVGYTFPKALLSKVFISKARVFFMGTNLLTFSKFKLWDPELDTSSGQKYPLPRTFTLGLTLSI